MQWGSQNELHHGVELSGTPQNTQMKLTKVETGRRKDVRKTVSHFVHHRAQLTVYPRTHEIPVPTADE